jgi:hypothetical protein
MVSAATHTMFGYTLMGVGITRVIEIAFVLRDAHSISEDGRSANSFQFIPCFLMYAAGFLFMGATEEQMMLVASSSMDHISYILITYSLASLMFLFVNILIGQAGQYSGAGMRVFRGDAIERGDGGGSPG